MKSLLVAALVAIVASASASSLQNEQVEQRRIPSESELMRSLDTGHTYVDRLEQLENELISNEIYAKRGSPFFKMAQFKRVDPQSKEVARQADRMLQATRTLKEKYGFSVEDLMTLRAGNAGSENETCLTVPTCVTSKYRTIDGSCNNLQSPLLGKAATTYRRVTPPNYSDGVEDVRLSTDGTFLKSARFVSTTVFGPRDRPIMNTLAVMQFGQFINHDFESTGTYNLDDGSGIMCCDSSGGFLSPALTHPECLAIEVPTTDPFYTRINVPRTCMNFIRSVAGVRIDCSLGFADQMNQNTHWLDGSTIYGSDSTTMASLRSYKSGQLLTSTDSSGRQLLPVTSGCTNGACFFAGDSRATEQPLLTLMHTLWMREHNRVAKRLASLNPTWTDEIIFQEARRIVIAEMQHITYAEWLPNLLAPPVLTSYGLLSSEPAYFNGYAPKATSGPVSNEFATAAFRVGHSMVRGLIQLLDQNGMLTSSSFNMSSAFFDSSIMVNQKTFLDSAIRGLLKDSINAPDNQVTNELGNLLFKGNSTYGFDLVALNIQRGRDHGLPSYNTYRQLCRLPKLNAFTDIMMLNAPTHRRHKPGPPPNKSAPPPGPPPTNLPDQLALAYNSVDDIDLFVGGLLESPIPGGNLGPTFSCLIAENFATVKQNDRFFYELGGQPHSFNPGQLAEIRKASMARIFCDNSDGTIAVVQPKAFLPAGGMNAPVPCVGPAIASVDLNLWKNERV